MKSLRFWLSVFAAGITINVFDHFVAENWLEDLFSTKMTGTLKGGPEPLWSILAEVGAGFVFTLVYSQVYERFRGGMVGGAMYGLFAGVLIDFPLWLYSYQTSNGPAYELAWKSAVYGVALSVITGLIIGAIYTKEVSSEK